MANQSHETILLVEDHREFQELVTALLEAEGYAVVAEGSCAGALAILETLRPSLILLDSSLPDGDGVQLAQAIRTRRGGVPVVLMTTTPRNANTMQAFGAADVLVKPFSTAALLSTVRARLGQQAGRPTPQVADVANDFVSNTRELGDTPPSRLPSPPPPAAPPTPAPGPSQPVPATGQWEYCQLIAAGRHEIRGETYYSVDLIFMGATLTTRRLASHDGPAAAPWATNPWKQTIGLLGLAGWEMVSIQHGDYAGRAAEHSTLSWNTVVAYFRRPVVPGRAITEPKISLSRS